MKVLVVFHTRYGHLHEMAKAVLDGVKDVPGVEPVLRRVKEFPGTVDHMEQEKGHSFQVYQALQSVPECTIEDLQQADGVLFGSPAQYGNMSAQMKALFDITPNLWRSMEGKPAGVFTSTSSMHGGQESTLLSMMIPLLHLGMMVVGVPYSVTGMLHAEARGGTPYGATTIAGPTAEFQPSDADLTIAKAQGKRVAETALALCSQKTSQ